MHLDTVWKRFVATLKFYACVPSSQCIPSHCRCHPVKYSPASGLGVQFHSAEEKKNDGAGIICLLTEIPKTQPANTTLRVVATSRGYFFFLLGENTFFCKCTSAMLHCLRLGRGACLWPTRLEFEFVFSWEGMRKKKMQVNHLVSSARSHH